MQRRLFVGGLVSMATSAMLTRTSLSAADMTEIESLQNNWRDFLSAELEVPLPATPLQESLTDWQKRLPPKAFQVLFEEATEPPFSSPLNDEKRAGLFLCAACDLPLFSSAMKYDSGTGWPSFFTSIPNHLGTKTDLKLIWPRTEYHCVRCNGHQGHVFDDGPAPTRQRWCNNGLALRFVASTNKT